MEKEAHSRRLRCICFRIFKEEFESISVLHIEYFVGGQCNVNHLFHVGIEDNLESTKWIPDYDNCWMYLTQQSQSLQSVSASTRREKPAGLALDTIRARRERMSSSWKLSFSCSNKKSNSLATIEFSACKRAHFQNFFTLKSSWMIERVDCESGMIILVRL